MLWQGRIVHAWLNAKLEAKTQGFGADYKSQVSALAKLFIRIRTAVQ